MSASDETEMRFWQQVIVDAQRTIVCSPETESRIKSWIDARGLSHMLTVIVNPQCPDDRVFVIDAHALDAIAVKPIRIESEPGRYSWITPPMTPPWSSMITDA